MDEIIDAIESLENRLTGIVRQMEGTNNQRQGQREEHREERQYFREQPRQNEYASYSRAAHPYYVNGGWWIPCDNSVYTSLINDLRSENALLKEEIRHIQSQINHLQRQNV
ncbi:hypothetical protein TetV_073 [Tetraselmis virus 1]|uniref:Uncharacterized protein n=1 Tax=Tetraselmis virus 1 TaxID=2060617 RepID=A0A2P0VMN6_9VIRU|nr:hypothetical protein QJ968_gp073 [Tetraselmis virus 1]AUF82165.1 hypothetical protein TetV_073 [Tetraselmis virus 1]